MWINITIRDGFGNILDTVLTKTYADGGFNVTFTVGVDWDDDTEVWVNFYPEDTFNPPKAYYIARTEQEVFRQT